MEDQQEVAHGFPIGTRVSMTLNDLLELP